MRKGGNNMYDTRNFPILYKKKKTLKQKEKTKKLNSQLDKLNKQVDVIDKEINKFKKQHQKIFDKLSILQLKSDNLCERWTNKWDIVNEYEEKFIVRDTREIAVA